MTLIDEALNIIALAVQHFDVEVEQIVGDVDGERVVYEINMHTFDRSTGLPILTIPLFGEKPSDTEIEQAVDTFLTKRAALLEHAPG